MIIIIKRIQRREQEVRKAAELALRQKDEHIRRLIEEKEARIQQVSIVFIIINVAFNSTHLPNSWKVY